MIGCHDRSHAVGTGVVVGHLPLMNIAIILRRDAWSEVRGRCRVCRALIRRCGNLVCIKRGGVWRLLIKPEPYYQERIAPVPGILSGDFINNIQLLAASRL